MKLLFTRFPLESALGGAEIQTLTLMEGLRDSGHAVAFLGSCPVLIEETRKRQLPVAILDIGAPPVTKTGALSFLWRKQKMEAQLRASLEQFHDLKAVFMLSLTEKLLATEWLSKRGTKVFWIEHDRIGPWLTRNPWLPLLKKQSEFATTITVSELSKKMYVELGWNPNRIVTIPNGIDPKRFSSRPDSRTSIPDSLRVGCVSRLSPEKGIDVLLEAVTDLLPVPLTIVGTGKEETFLRSWAQRINDSTDGRITIVPTVPDLGAFYASLDVLVLPSREHDPFGLVAAEAMMLGIPVIVTDACGIAGYLTDGVNALIAKADDADSLRSAIERLRNPALCSSIASKGKEIAQRLFTAETMIKRYAEVIAG